LYAKILNDSEVIKIVNADDVKQFEQNKGLLPSSSASIDYVHALSRLERLESRKIGIEQPDRLTGGNRFVENLSLSKCYTCKRAAIWHAEKLLYPEFSSSEAPNADLPPDVLELFEEAQSIFGKSPRGGAALLRLALQKLCRFAGEEEKNLNQAIKNIVKNKGLDPRIQKALDIVRIFGNNAVHPGEIDLAEQAETATRLFGLINVIADALITRPKAIDALYEDLPPGAKEGIASRDKKT
jgi:hypothetical protein